MFACFDCCDAANPGGWEVADQAWGDCICQTTCAQACEATARFRVLVLDPMQRARLVVEDALADLPAPGRGRAPDELAARLRIAGGGDDRGESVHPGRPAVAVQVEVPDLGEGGRYLDRRLNPRHRSRAGSG